MSEPSTSQAAFRALNSVAIPLAMAGIGSPCRIGAGVVVLETTGRRSQQPRLVPLAATRWQDRVTVRTVRQDSLWVQNLEADANCAVWLDGERRTGVATSIARGPLTTVVLQITTQGREQRVPSVRNVVPAL
jgi:hypothetical protein